MDKNWTWLEEALKTNWNTVERMDLNQCQEMFDRFVRKCVKDSFAGKFVREYGGRKPMTPRFFRDFALTDRNAQLALVFGPRWEERLPVRVQWGDYRSPIGYLLSGQPKHLADLFVDVYDAIAEIQLHDAVAYLLYDSARGHVFRFPTKDSIPWRK